MMRKLLARIAKIFGNGNGNKPDEQCDSPVVVEAPVTRKNVDSQTSRIRARAVMARLQLAEVERKLAPPAECAER